MRHNDPCLQGAFPRLALIQGLSRLQNAFLASNRFGRQLGVQVQQRAHADGSLLRFIHHLIYATTFHIQLYGSDRKDLLLELRCQWP